MTEYLDQLLFTYALNIQPNGDLQWNQWLQNNRNNMYLQCTEHIWIFLALGNYIIPETMCVEIRFMDFHGRELRLIKLSLITDLLQVDLLQFIAI